MSDHDIKGFENMIEAAIALQRRYMKTYAIRDLELCENIAGQSGNSALIEALARLALQIQLCGTLATVSREFAERAAHWCDDIIEAFKARDIPRAAFLVRRRISHTQEAILASFPDEAASR
jgi:DNA-binding GntR family transcriptional regulator